MTGLADLHVHLLAGLDDGPRTADDALAMCRIAADQGVRHAAALSHQSERWQVTPDAIRSAVKSLAEQLAREGVPLSVHPTAEVTATPTLIEDWKAGRLLSVGDHGRCLLVEMPHQLFVDLRPAVRGLGRLGVRVLLAHPERHPELLHEPGTLEELIGLGCFVQVSSASVTDPATPADARALRDWFRRGCVHVLGSDGHSPRKRRPLMADACARVREWAGADAADRIGRDNGLALLRGERLAVAPPRARRPWWSLCPW
ncbi:MAG: tyrosine-protein phosphatase [Gemmataceae bacterium]